ncbi:PREDICTED: structure-specific endonuclease subunit slx1 [Polistes dominula]|uniref:Structure-specific endonuclease subunit SLX1 homolog n=1 Tax=Polistes dominula TaxID=743375 RepID=A0ABM1IW77_POLDO|nr:PREDICTED: structure-specific endonuclease subunit slx1 [Polistes dominula]
MEETEIVEHFYGVYLLYCLNPKYKGRIYIGYTVDPQRRIKQHNAGKKHGGAWRTSERGPWSMVLIVHGFLNSTSALRFEWAWQHPHESRRLKHVPKKKSTEKTIEFYLMVLSEMLKVGPWYRLPLTIRWLDDNFAQLYSTSFSPPLHMPICYGQVLPRKVTNKSPIKENNLLVCSICGLISEKDNSIRCIKPDCRLIAHLICLAKRFSTDDHILPIEGTCPTCNTNVLWGDLIKKMIGCYQDIQSNVNEDDCVLVISSDED